MALGRVKTWIAGEVLTAADLNSEFNNILNNGPSLILPFAGAVDFDGQTLTLDSAAVTTVNSTARTAWNFAPGGKAGTPSTTGSTSNWAANTFTDSNTAGSGTATVHVGFAFQQPTFAATNTSVTTTDAATVYIANAPAAGTNQTLTNAYALWVDAGRVRFDGSIDHAATATAASATTTDLGAEASNNVDISGTTTITGFGTANEGIIRRGRFTGALTLTHNATSLILPGGANITTAANDRYEAKSLGSGNWLVLDYVKANGEPVTGTSAIPSGTVMLFFQASAPTGWTQVVANNDSAIRMVSGTGGGTGGTVAFETAFASQTPAAAGGVTGAHTLTESEMPAHTHTIDTDNDVGATVVSGNASVLSASTRSTSSTGGGGSHTHTWTGVAIDLDVQYINVIQCSKD